MNRAGSRPGGRTVGTEIVDAAVGEAVHHHAFWCVPIAENVLLPAIVVNADVVLHWSV